MDRFLSRAALGLDAFLWHNAGLSVPDLWFRVHVDHFLTVVVCSVLLNGIKVQIFYSLIV